MRYILILLLILISCKREEEPNVMNFNMTKGVPVIYTTINGKGAKLLVDSGATVSIIDVTLKDYFQFIIDESDDRINGIGGSEDSGKVYKCIVKYNDSILDIDFKYINFKSVRSKIGVVGVVGSDFLKDNYLIIDYNKNQIYSSK